MATARTPASLVRTLLALTVASGLVDAVCYLGLGRVFTANMTGNIVVLGFAAAGAPGFSVPATLTSLVLFLAGAACASRVAARMQPGRRSRMLLAAMATETVFVGAAALIAFCVHSVGGGWPRYLLIAILAFAMGVRNATVRRLAVPDMTTTVLTMTLTGLAADSFLAGGHNQGSARRTAAVVAMLAGAVVSAWLFLHISAALPLLVAAVLVGAAGIGFWRSKGRAGYDAPAAGEA
jgi:uncharacterized membrane protein YoaK (UPF0700 family)